MLAGLPPGTRPVRARSCTWHWPRAATGHVLDQLVANQYLTRAQADAAYSAPCRCGVVDRRG